MTDEVYEAEQEFRQSSPSPFDLDVLLGHFFSEVGEARYWEIMKEYLHEIGYLDESEK